MADNIRASRFVAADRAAHQSLVRVLPPKTDEMERTLWDSINRASLAPSFVSVTYGAGGSDARAHARDREAHPHRDPPCRPRT